MFKENSGSRWKLVPGSRSRILSSHSLDEHSRTASGPSSVRDDRRLECLACIGTTSHSGPPSKLSKTFNRLMLQRRNANLGPRLDLVGEDCVYDLSCWIYYKLIVQYTI